MPGRRVIVFEKEGGVGRHQTGHNSGVQHAGLYYKPGSNKARLAVKGIRQMVRFCAENGVKHDICGKLVVAATDEEVPRMMDLFERGTANGLAGLRVLDRDGMLEIEPHVGGVRALRVPEEGIVDYAGVCAALVRKIQEAGRRGADFVRGDWVARDYVGVGGLNGLWFEPRRASAADLFGRVRVRRVGCR